MSFMYDLHVLSNHFSANYDANYKIGFNVYLFFMFIYFYYLYKFTLEIT